MPVSSVAMAVEGLLMKPFSAIPIPTGIALYHTFKENFNVLLYSDSDRKTLDHWLSIESLNIHAAVEYNESPRHWLTESERKLTQVSSLRQRGYRIEIVVEPDPESSAVLVTNGFNVLHFVHSQYAMPQWRPDFTGKDRKWATLEQAANQMAEMKALDNRLKEHLDSGRDWE